MKTATEERITSRMVTSPRKYGTYPDATSMLDAIIEKNIQGTQNAAAYQEIAKVLQLIEHNRSLPNLCGFFFTLYCCTKSLPPHHLLDDKIRTNNHYRMLCGIKRPDVAWRWPFFPLIGIDGRQLLSIAPLASQIARTVHRIAVVSSDGLMDLERAAMFPRTLLTAMNQINIVAKSISTDGAYGSKKTFAEFISAMANDPSSVSGTYIIVAKANWCGACQTFTREQLPALAKSSKCTVLVVNTDDSEAMTSLNTIKSKIGTFMYIPSIAIVENGRVKQKFKTASKTDLGSYT